VGRAALWGVGGGVVRCGGEGGAHLKGGDAFRSFKGGLGTGFDLTWLQCGGIEIFSVAALGVLGGLKRATTVIKKPYDCHPFGTGRVQKIYDWQGTKKNTASEKFKPERSPSVDLGGLPTNKRIRV